MHRATARRTDGAVNYYSMLKNPPAARRFSWSAEFIPLQRLLLVPVGLEFTDAFPPAYRAGKGGTCPRSPKPRRALDCGGLTPLSLHAWLARGARSVQSPVWS